MSFSKEGLEELRKEHLAVHEKYQRLLSAYTERNWNGPRAHEYATQGFLRRLKTLVRCIDKVFEILPPDSTELPANDDLSDAAINIQAFVFNAFGCADNFAWIWVQEKGLTREDGSPIPNNWVGLGKKNELVRHSFSPEFQKFLKELDGWFDYLEDFRHALAHRIPLYVPPHVVLKDKEPAYRELEHRMAEAIDRHDYAEHDRLSVEQTSLVVFGPYMTHSFEEKAKIVVLHPQLLTDFNTIAQLAQKMLEELDQ